MVARVVAGTEAVILEPAAHEHRPLIALRSTSAGIERLATLRSETIERRDLSYPSRRNSVRGAAPGASDARLASRPEPFRPPFVAWPSLRPWAFPHRSAPEACERSKAYHFSGNILPGGVLVGGVHIRITRKPDGALEAEASIRVRTPAALYLNGVGSRPV